MERPRQIPLDLGHGTAYSRDDLVVSSSNAEAAALVDRWPDWPAPVVVLAGPAGSGKTHLAAIWREMADARVVEAGQVEAAAATFDGRPVLVDDIDTGTLDQEGLFHLINAVRAGGSQLFLTDPPVHPARGATSLVYT